MAASRKTDPDSVTQPGTEPTTRTRATSSREPDPETVTIPVPGFGPTRVRGAARDDLRGHQAAVADAGGPADDEPASGTRSSPVDDWNLGSDPAGPGTAPGSGPSQGSTDRQSAAQRAAGVDFWAGIVGGLAGMAAVFVHNRRTPWPEGNDIWIATDDELAAVGQSVGRIINRHSPAGLRPDSDIADAVETVMVLAGYGIRNSVAEAQLARATGGGPVIDTSAEQTPASPDERPAGPPAGADPASVIGLLGATPPGMGPL